MRRAPQYGGGTSSGGGGGGGSVNSVSGDETTITSTGGTDPTLSALFGTGTGLVQEATADALGATLDASLGNGLLKLASAVLTAATLVNADVSASAAIAGSKISPDFGSQNIVTTGTLGAGATTITSLVLGTLTGVLKASSGTVSASTIVNADVNASAAIVASKLDLTTIAQNIANTGTFGNTGDATITGALTVTGTTTLATSLTGVVKAASGVLSAATLVNTDVSASAAIAGTKISPDFGSQNVSTTGTLAAGATTINNATANSTAADFQTAGTSVLQVGNDASGAFVRSGTNPASIGLIRVANATTIISARNAANSANLSLVATDSSNQLLIGSTTGVGATIVSGSSTAQLAAGGGTKITVSSGDTTVNGQSSWVLSQFIAANYTYGWGARSGNNPTYSLTIQGMVASGTASTVANKHGGRVNINGGSRTDTAGTRGGVALFLDAGTTMMFQVADVQPEATSASRVLSLCRTSAITATEMQTGTGDLVLYIGECATPPSANPVSGGILYVESGALKYRGTGGTVTTVGPA